LTISLALVPGPPVKFMGTEEGEKKGGGGKRKKRERKAFTPITTSP